MAIEGVSLLGDHNGIMDDDLLRELMDDEDFGGDPLTDSAP